jgi:hypothetical protein
LGLRSADGFGDRLCTGKKLKPIVYEDLIRIAEVDGEPVAFMLTLPDLNEVLKPLRRIAPTLRLDRSCSGGCASRKARTMRVPLMGVKPRAFRPARLASQLAFMMIEFIRRDAIVQIRLHARRDWLGPRRQSGHERAIADAIESKINKEYVVYDKAL